MPLTTESPRFSLRVAAFDDIEKAIGSVGHVVLDDVWNSNYIRTLYGRAKATWQANDERFIGKFDQFAAVLIEQYLSGHTDLDSLSSTAGLDCTAGDNEFFVELERSGLPALLRRLHRCDIVFGRSERVFRRADPRFPIRFTGLHHDGQLGPCSRNGLASKLEFTIWTPLQPCADEDTPRLLLIHREDELSLPEAKTQPEITHPLLLKPRQVRDEEQYLASIGSIDDMFEHVYRNARCYAPHLPMGSAILFDHRVFHATYRTSRMKTPRYSVDFRSVGEYRRTKENRRYASVIYRSETFPVVGQVDKLRIRARRTRAAVSIFLRRSKRDGTSKAASPLQPVR
jgi:hypothetical protein